jgi:hypothetical protein
MCRRWVWRWWLTPSRYHLLSRYDGPIAHKTDDLMAIRDGPSIAEEEPQFTLRKRVRFLALW